LTGKQAGAQTPISKAMRDQAEAQRAEAQRAINALTVKCFLRSAPAAVPAAQKDLYRRAHCNQAARCGDYSLAMEAK